MSSLIHTLVGKVTQLVSALAAAVLGLGLGSMPPKRRQSRLPTALRSALAQFQARTASQDVAADLIRKHAERLVLCAQLPPGDPRLPAVEALMLVLGMRTFNDSAISLNACLRDIQEVGNGGR